MLHSSQQQGRRTETGSFDEDRRVNIIPLPVSSVGNRGRNLFQTPRVLNPPLWRPETHRNSMTGHFSTPNPGFVRRPDHLNQDVSTILSEATVTSLMQDENSLPQHNIGRYETIQPDRGSRVRSTKSITPHATKSVPKV